MRKLSEIIKLALPCFADTIKQWEEYDETNICCYAPGLCGTMESICAEGNIAPEEFQLFKDWMYHEVGIQSWLFYWLDEQKLPSGRWDRFTWYNEVATKLESEGR